MKFKKNTTQIKFHGIEVGIRNSNGEALKEGDVLWQEGNKVLVVRIPYCDCIVLSLKICMRWARLAMRLGKQTCTSFY